MIRYRVILEGVPVVETHCRETAYEIAEAANASVQAYAIPEPSRVPRLFWSVATAVAVYVAYAL